MAVQSPPFALQNSAHSAALFRQAVSNLFYNPGPMDAASLVVSAQTTPNMSVQVAPGGTWLDGTQVANLSGLNYSTQGSYYALNDASVTLTIAASDPTNPRIDVVYLAVNDSQYSGITNNAVLGVVTGTPASSPTTPATPNNSIALATVRVNATVTTITNANITAYSSGPASYFSGSLWGSVIACTSTSQPSNVRLGQPIYETDTQLAKIWSGGSWTTIGPSAWTTASNSTYSYALTTTANTALPTISGGTNASITVTVPTGRVMEVEFICPQWSVQINTNAFVRMVDSVGGTLLDGAFSSTNGSTAISMPFRLRGFVTGDGASHTVTIQGWLTSGTSSIQAAPSSNGSVVLRYRFS